MLKRSSYKLFSFLAISLLLICTGCYTNELDKQLASLPKSDNPMVFMVFAPDCPLCNNYGAEFHRLQEKFESQADFYAILPGKFYSKQEVDSFVSLTGMETTVINDLDWGLCKALGAIVTPEFFVVNECKVVYSGKMDDWAALIGVKRRKATEFYLQDALEATLADKKIEPKRTKPVGCILEYDEAP